MSNFDYTRYYNQWHPDNPEHIVKMQRHSYRRVRDWVQGRQDEPVLDVGCGKGYLVGALIQQKFTNVTGIDIDKGQILAAQNQGLPVQHVEDTVDWLRQKRGSYKVIFCFDVIEHIPLPQQVEFVKAMQEALLDGGIFLCSVPNANSSFAARYRYGDYTHSSAFTEHSLDFLLFHGGFSEIRILEDEIRPRMPWILRPQLRWWYLLKVFRFVRRIEAIAEMGWRHGRIAPLSLNLFGIAQKQP